MMKDEGPLRTTKDEGNAAASRMMDADAELLARVPWQELRHAYGKADDTPTWLIGLRSVDTKTRKKALDNLWASICHQGSRYSASPYAVAFLLRLVEDQSVPDRDEIILLLLHLGISFPEQYYPAGFDLPASLSYMRTAEGYDDYFQTCADTYQAVRRGVPAFLKLLDDRDLGVRVASAYALAWFKEEAPQTLPALHRRLSRTRRVTEISSLLLSLAVLNGSIASRSDRSVFEAFLAQASSRLVRTCAAIGLAVTERTITSEAVLATLFEALKYDRTPPRFHWLNGDMHWLVLPVLGSAGSSKADSIVPTLCALIADGTCGGLAGAALAELLFAKSSEPVAGYAALTRHQQLFVRTLAAQEAGWDNTFLLGSLSACGLPESRAEMQAYIASAE